jgi:uncharacterized protein YcbK (DUF882 family)
LQNFVWRFYTDHVRQHLAAPVCAALMFMGSAASTETAIANGDTRTLSFHHMHTGEDFTVTFKKNGYYDDAALEKLNWSLRDWRIDEPTKMDPRLFDILWEVYRESGSSETIHVLSAYRSPQTNAMLRRRSHQVAKHSQHMLGKAMDFFLPDMTMSKIREIGLRLQRGGVGYYPNANTVFVHLDAGGVRYWPRMSREQLARVFPDGKTVLMPTDGQPMPGYQQALAEIESRGGTAVAATGERPAKGLFAWLFGGNNNVEEEEDTAPDSVPAKAPIVMAKAKIDGEDTAPAPKVRDIKPSQKAEQIAKPENVASLEAKNQADAEEPPTPRNTFATLATTPLPPSRPAGLQQFALTGPLPPTRPVELAALARAKSETLKKDPNTSDPISQLLAKADVSLTAPAAITSEKIVLKQVDSSIKPNNIMAYAQPDPAIIDKPVLRAPPPPRPAPVRALINPKSELVAAQLNRAALQSKSTTRPAIANAEGIAPATGLRQIAQRQSPAAEQQNANGDRQRIVSRFTTMASMLPLTTGHFSGSAVKALTPEDGFRQIETASN